MLSIGIYKARTKLSEYLRRGVPIQITSHRKNIAVIYPSIARDEKRIKRDIRAINAADKLTNSADIGDYL